MPRTGSTPPFYVALLVQLTAFLCLGVLVAFLLPPFQSPDEPVHWSAAYQRSERMFGLLRGDGPACVPAFSLAEHFEVGRIAFNVHEKFRQSSFDHLRTIKPGCNPQYLGYGGALSYPGVLLARLLVSNENAKPDRAVKVFYVARLLQGLLVSFALFWLVCLARRSGKASGLVLTLSACLSPLFLQQSFTVSADTITLLASITLVAVMCFWDELRKTEFFLIGITVAASSYTKPTLYPLVIVAFVAGASSFYLHSATPRIQEFLKLQRKRLLWSAAVVSVGFLAALAISVQPHEAAANQVLGRNLDAAAQLQHIKSNLLATFGVFHHSLIARLNFDQQTNHLGWLSMSLSRFTLHKVGLMLIFAFAAELLVYATTWRFLKATNLLLPLVRIGYCVLALGLSLLGLYLTALLTPAAMYLIWTEVGQQTVTGLQGRYFFPCLLLVPALVFTMLNPQMNSAAAQCCSYAEERGLQRTFNVAFVIIFVVLAILLAVGLHHDFMRRYW